MSPPQASRVKFSDATVAALTCPEGKKDRIVFDATEPGFGVRVTIDGKRVFLFQYRAGKAVRRHRIGVWGQGGLTTTKARKEAERLRGRVHTGQDPVADKRALRLAEAAAETAALTQAAADAFTFSRLVTAWETKGLAGRRPPMPRP